MYAARTSRFEALARAISESMSTQCCMTLSPRIFFTLLGICTCTLTASASRRRPVRWIGSSVCRAIGGAQFKGSKYRRSESADGDGQPFAALVVVVLGAVAEEATPGGGGVLVLLARPVPVRDQVRLAVGEQQRSLLARRQVAAHALGPGAGIGPGHAFGRPRCHADQVVLDRAVLVEDGAGVVLAGVQLDVD